MTNGSGSAWSDTIRRGFVGFLAIFLGVSLSFVAEDWRESLGEAWESRRVLAGVQADLREDLSMIRWYVRTDSTAAAAALWLHQEWDAPRLSPDSLAWVLSVLAVASPYSAIGSEYESAKSSGRLQYIGDHELRNQITRVYERDQPHLVRVNAIKLDFGFRLWDRLRPYVSYAEEFGEQPVLPGMQVVEWDRARRDQRLRNGLVESLGFRRLYWRQMKDHEARTIALIDRIAEEIGAAPPLTDRD